MAAARRASPLGKRAIVPTMRSPTCRMSQVWQRPFIPKSILVDAGPLIAMLDRSDKNHRQIKRFLEEFRGRMLTTWPVLAEACHFLPERTQIRFLRWAAAGGWEMVELRETALAEIADWKEKYRDLPMDLADASLLWVAEQTGIMDILMIDLRDFSAYRLRTGKGARPHSVAGSINHPNRLGRAVQNSGDTFLFCQVLSG